MKKASFTINILLILLGCCLSLTIGELLVRLAGYKPLVSETKLSLTGYFWICDKRLGFRNRPNASYCDQNITAKPIINTDKYGYRNGFGWSYDSLSPILLFVGDSTTFCSEVNDDNTGPSEVAKLIGGELNVRVLNAGVRGYSTLQSKRMLEECVERFPEIKVVVYTFANNDYYENLNPNIYFPAKAPIGRWSQGELQIIEITEPTVAWGHDFTGSLRRELAYNKVINKIRSYSALFSVLGRQPLLAWREIIAYSRYFQARNNHGDQVLEELVRQMNQICHSHGIIFLSTAFFNGLDEKGPDFEAICKKKGVRYIDIKEWFVDTPTSYMAQRCDGTYDIHYGMKGTKTFAEALIPALKTILARSPGNR